MRAKHLFHLLAGILLLTLSAVTSHAQPTVYRIMPLGDSITQADIYHNSYRRPLWRLLNAANFAVDFVGSQTEHYVPRASNAPNPDFDLDHEGHAGWRADQLEAQVAAWAAQMLPDVVLLHVGTNDLMAQQTADSTRDELAAIIGKLRAANPSVIVLLAQIIPHNIPPEMGIAPVDALNARIAELAVALHTPQSPVIVVDMATGFDATTMLDPDRIHPSLTGERLMALRWYDALRRVLPNGDGSFELLSNGSFEVKADGWTLSVNTGDKVRCADGYTGHFTPSCAFRFRGETGEYATLSQTIYPHTADTLTVRGMLRTTADPPDGVVRLKIRYADGAKARVTVPLSASPDYAPFASTAYTVDRPVLSATLIVIHRSTGGFVYLDDLSVTAQRAMP